GFALMSLVPILLAVYLLWRTGGLRPGSILGEGGVILLFMVLAAVSGMYFLRQEMSRMLLSILRETLKASPSGDSRFRRAHFEEKEIEDLTGEIQAATSRLEDDLRRSNDAVVRLRAAIDRVTESLGVAREPESLERFLVESARGAVQARDAAFLAVDEDKAVFVVVAACGESEQDWQGVEIPLGEGIPALAISKRKAVLLRSAQINGIAAEPHANQPARGIAVPLFRGETLHGVLALREREDGSPFSLEDLSVVANLAGFMVFDFDHRSSRARLEAGLEEVLLLLATAVEERDPYAKGHADRVARYAVEMARVLRLDENTIKMLRWGALLHDIGKLALPDSLLKKEGEYTPEEMEIVRQHPIIAEKMIRRAESLSSACTMVRNHNERCDGSGYPDGLQGSDIPLTTHILMVANVFDAMTSDRSFRRAMSVAEALERLRSAAGTKYDRRAIKALTALDEKLQVRPSGREEGAIVRGQGTSSICIRT
ncbi:MAG TPA: HD domain-containing phosphohydrolase, partial [bacterium]|nr:HD domain-containing phosphohydrolase [bacterium]